MPPCFYVFQKLTASRAARKVANMIQMIASQNLKSCFMVSAGTVADPGFSLFSRPTSKEVGGSDMVVDRKLDWMA